MLPVHLIQQNSSSLMQCTPSIECEPQYEHLAAGVVAIYAVDPRSRTVSLCSGASNLGSAPIHGNQVQYWLCIPSIAV